MRIYRFTNRKLCLTHLQSNYRSSIYSSRSFSKRSLTTRHNKLITCSSDFGGHSVPEDVEDYFFSENWIMTLNSLSLLIVFVAAIPISAGDKCVANCLWCRDAICNECKQNFYGEDCEHECVRCSDGCEKSDGTCRHCQHGYYGNNCSTSCPANCRGSLDDGNVRCNKYNGACLHGCKDSWWGELCDSRCSEDCVRGKCFSLDGTCEKRVSSTAHTSATSSKILTARYGPDAYKNVSTAVKPTLKVLSGVLAIVFITASVMHGYL